MRTSLDRSEASFDLKRNHLHDDVTDKIVTGRIPTVSPIPSLDNKVTVVIHKSQLYSDCLARSIQGAARETVVAYGSVEGWLEYRHLQVASLVIICVSGLSKEAEAQQLGLLLSQTDNAIPVVVMGDSESPSDIIDVLAKGGRGYIPTSLSLDITVKALHLVRAGGVFIPANSLLESQRATHTQSSLKQTDFGLFTAKQATVIEGIRLGKANKTIAYELNMCESTVKVHVRNIMKKLQAKNRTQVAFIANQMLK